MNHRRWNIGTLTTADRVAVRAHENERIIIDQIWVTNKDTSNRNFDIHHVPAGDTGSVNDFSLIFDHALNAKTYEVIDTKIYMNPGDEIQVGASAGSAIVVNFYGRVFYDRAD